MKERRSNDAKVCPRCKSTFLAIIGDKVACLMFNCGWQSENMRAEDGHLRTLKELEEIWNG